MFRFDGGLSRASTGCRISGGVGREMSAEGGTQSNMKASLADLAYHVILRTLTRDRRTSMFWCAWLARFGCMVPCSSLRLGCSACFHFWSAAARLGTMKETMLVSGHRFSIDVRLIFYRFEFVDVGVRASIFDRLLIIWGCLGHFWVHFGHLAYQGDF